MAGKKISGITGELILNVNKWSAGVKQAQKDGKALESALKPISTLAMDMGKTLSAAGLAVGGSLLTASKIAANYGDALAEASEKTGLTTQELGKLKFAAEQNDSSFEGLSTGLKFLSKNMFDAATGGKENQKVFKALGISTRDASGAMRPMNEVLLQTSDVFKRIPDGTEKSALAMKLFGKSGQEMIPFLNQGSEGIKKLSLEAERLGLAIDPASAKLGDDFNNALNRSKNAALGLSVSIGNVLLPTLIDLVDKGNEAVIWAAGIAREYPIATKATAGLAVAITGAGGLLLGLAGIATVAPKVATGLKMITTAMAGTEILLMVRNYGDLSAAISLIGEKGVLAKAGLVGFAAFIGYTAGQMINGAIAASGYQKQIDSLILTLTKSVGPLGYVIGKWAGGQAVIDDAAKQAAATTKRSAELLAQAGVTQEQATAKAKGLFEANQKLKASQQAAAESTNQFKIDLGAFNNEATKTADKVKQLNESFVESVKPADALQKTIGLLKGEFATQTNILKVYGPQIIETVESQKAMGLQVSSLMANYYALAKAETTAMEADKEFQDLLTQRAQRMAQWNQTLENSKVGATEWTVEIDRSNQVNLEGVKVLGQMRGSITETTAKIKGMQTAGRSDAEIIAVLGGEMRTAADTANKLKIALDPTIDRLLRQADAADRAAQRAKNLQDSWGRAMSNMVTQTAHSLADMIVDWDFSFKTLAGIAKNTAKDMLGSFLEGFFQPFEDRLNNLGQKAGSWAANIAFGSQQQASQANGGGGGLLGGLLGSFGGGTGPGGTPPFVEGGYGGNMGGGGLLDILGGWLNKGQGAPVQTSSGGTGSGGTGGRPLKIGPVEVDPVGLYKSVTNAVGEGRKAANELVKLQNSFDQALNGIVASSASTTSKAFQIERAWQEFKEGGALFAGGDLTRLKVVNQAIATELPKITQLRSDFGGVMAPSAVGGATSITVNATFNHTNTYSGTELTPIVIRDVIIPEEIRVYKENIRGYGEALAEAIVNKMKGLSGSEVPTPA